MGTSVNATSPAKRTKMESYMAWFFKWFPESFFICLILTIVVILGALAIGTPFWSFDPAVPGVVDSWVKEFWSLIAFTMQMVVLLVTGNAVAASPPAKKILAKLASFPKSQLQVILAGVAVSAFIGYFHWGIGMMGGIMFGKELLASAKKRGIKVHKPVLVTAIFLTFMPAAAGLSGAGAVMPAGIGYLKGVVAEKYVALTPDSIPLGASVGSLRFIITLLIGIVVCTAVCLLMLPKKGQPVEEISDEMLEQFLGENDEYIVEKDTPAQRMNNSRIVMYLFGGLGFAWSILEIAKVGLGGLSLNLFNFFMLTLGMLLCGRPELFAKHIREGLDGTWGFVLQFPFYAGIFGIMKHSGLDSIISHFFIDISTARTFPVITFIYSALMDLIVTSGGSKFVIEAPYIIPAAIEVNADLPTIICAYQLGDGVSNVLTPFFCLPYMASFGIEFKKIIPYSLIAGLCCYVVYSLCLYFMF